MKVVLAFLVLCLPIAVKVNLEWNALSDSLFLELCRVMVQESMALFMTAEIFLVGVIAWLSYAMQSRHVLKSIRKAERSLISARKQTGSLVDDWEAVRDAFEAIGPNFERLLRRYEGVIEDVSDVVRARHLGTKHRWVSVAEPEAFFNTESLYNSVLNAPLYASMPGFLTGLGLLFTFVGLACGITLAQGGLIPEAGSAPSAPSLSTVSGLIESVGSLLGGAGQAFYTSIAGLLMSILVGSAIFIREKEIARAVEQLNDVLEDDIPVVTVEYLQFQTLVKTGEQEKFMRELVPQIKADMESFREAILNGLADNSKEVGETLTRALDNLKSVLQQMKGAESITIADALKVVIEQMEENLTQVLQNMSGSFSESAVAVKKSVEALEVIVSKLKTEVESSGEVAKAQILKLAEEAEGVNKGLLSTLTTAVDTLNQEVGEAASAMSESVQTAGKTISGTVEAAGKALSGTVEAAGKTLSDTLETTGKTISGTVEAAGKSAEESIGKLMAPVTELHERLHESAEVLRTNFEAMENSSAQTKTNFEAVASQLAESMQSVDRIVESLKAEAIQFSSTVETLRAALVNIRETGQSIAEGKASTDKTLAGVIDSAKDIMTNATEAVTGELMRLQTMLETITKLQNSVLTQSTRVNDLMDQSVKTLGDAVESIHTSLSRNLVTADEKLASAVTHMSEGFRTWRDEQTAYVNELNDLLARVSGSVNAWVKAEEARVRKIKQDEAARQKTSAPALPGGRA